MPMKATLVGGGGSQVRAFKQMSAQRCMSCGGLGAGSSSSSAGGISSGGGGGSSRSSTH